MQGEGLLKGDFFRFFLGQTPIDEKLMNQCVDKTNTNGVLLVVRCDYIHDCFDYIVFLHVCEQSEVVLQQSLLPFLAIFSQSRSSSGREVLFI